MRMAAFLGLAALAGCASVPTELPDDPAGHAVVSADGWSEAAASQQEGRIAMSVRCPTDCVLGARMRAADGKALWISLSGADFGSVYLQEIGANGEVSGHTLLFESAMEPPFPSDEPVFVEIGFKNGELTGWAGDSRLWGFARRIEAELPPVGAWSVRHERATIANLIFEDAQARPYTAPRTGNGFVARPISDLFYSETVSIADVNRDGAPDIVTGGVYYLGPDFGVARQIFPITPTSPEGYSTGLVSATDDFNGDGWTDLLTIESGTDAGHPALIFINPHGENRFWDRHVIIEHTASEAIAYEDVDGDGRGELVVIADGVVGLARPGADPTQPWTLSPVSERRERWNPHGVGIGDIDGDGRRDVLHGSGWFKQPARAGDPWVFTEVSFGFGAQLHVEDLNGDRRADVIGSLDAHGWGLAWHEQQADGSFVRHLIMGNPAQTPPSATLATFSQPHAVSVADLNGDGLSDIVTGKRWWAHRDTYRDPDGHGRPVLYAFLQQRAGDTVTFTPHFIGDHVGVGNQIAVDDLNGDGRSEIVTTARKGTLIYENRLGR